MEFRKYSIKWQILFALVFIVLNFLVSYLSGQVLHLPLFMDMIFVYSAAFVGVPCGIITAILFSVAGAVFLQHDMMYSLYAVCTVTGVFLTWLLITRKEEFSWIRVALLIFLSSVIISLEGALIYALFFTEKGGPNENTSVVFLTYTLIMQNIGLYLSSFLARLPINLFDKAIAVLAGLGVFSLLSYLRPSQKA